MHDGVFRVVEQISIPDATQEPEAYVAALLDALGDHDPLEVYATTAAAIAVACNGLDESGWAIPLGLGEWNAHQIVGHLLDVDIVYGFRWRLVLTANAPSYPGYDERAWALLPKGSPTVVTAAFEALRRANVELIRSVTAEDLERRGVHGEQGGENVYRMLAKIAGHDVAHLNQLRRTIFAAGAAAGGPE